MSAPRSDVQYRMAEMLERVGFRIDYTPIYWTYASGFPKAMNMSKMIDKRGAAKQEDLNKWKTWFKEQLDKSKKSNKQINDECGFTATSYCKMDGKDNWTIAFPSKEKWEKIKEVMDLPNDDEYKIMENFVNNSDEFVKQRGHIETTGNLHISDEKKSIKFSGKQLSDNPYSDEAKRFDGAYGGFQPKPAVEVVIVAMKPMEEKGIMAQALKNGKAVTWFDDCRIPFEEGYVEPENQTMPDLRDVGKKSKEAIGIDKLSYGQVQNAKRKPYKEKPISSLPTEELIEKFGSIENYNSWKKENTKHWPKGGYGAMDIGIGKPGETQEYRSKDYENYVKKQKSFKGAKSIGKTIKGDEHFLSGDIKQLDPSENYQKPKTTNRKPRTEGSVFKESGFKSEDNDTAEASPMGRFPANLLVSDNIIDDGKIRTAKPHGGDGKPLDTQGMGWGFKRMASSISDSGGYSRYFSLDAWFEKNLKSLPEPVQQTFPFMIVPKASKAEKNNGLDNFETKQAKGGGGTSNDTWYEDDVNAASGKFGSEKAPSRNIHPTVKPLTLMNYLVTLGSRKGDVVLEPFAGSGTTALACVSQERDYIAIEREEEYYEIAKARLEKVEQPLKMWEKFSG
jgi:hypothetical protein